MFILYQSKLSYKGLYGGTKRKFITKIINKGEISMNKTVSIVTIVMLLFVVFFAGCVGKEQTQVVAPTSTQVVTPAPTFSPPPTITTVTSIPTPIPTPRPVNLTIPIKAGYKLYQNNEYSYGFGYPNNWDISDSFGLSENQLQGVGISHMNTLPNGEAPTMYGIMVVVFSSEPKVWWNEMYGSLDNASKAGVIKSAKNTTVNGQKAFEVVGNVFGSTERSVIIQANGYYYVMILYTPALDYISQTDKFDDVINSWVIGNISQ